MENKRDEQDQDKRAIDFFKIVLVKFFWKCRFRDDSPYNDEFMGPPVSLFDIRQVSC